MTNVMSRCNLLSLLLAALCLLGGCSEQIDTSVRYVFKDQTAMGYLEKHADVYGTYLSLLREVPVSSRSATTLSQLLSARGHYTVFAPTNDAVLHYLESLVREGVISAPSWDAFTDSARLDSIKRVVVYNSIIDSGDNDQCYETSRFPATEGAELPIANMNDRKLTVHYRVGYPDSLYVNRVCPINARNRDVLVLNGVIHQMEAVIAPQDITASDFFREILDCEKEGYLVMARAIQACGLLDTLRSVRDEVYEEKYQNGEVEDLKNMLNKGFTQSGNAYAPEHRKYGFTILAETDKFWRAQGLSPTDPDLLAKLQQWIADHHQCSEEEPYRADADYTDPDNLLNLWTTYHILPERLSTDRLVVHHNEMGYSIHQPMTLGIPVWDFYTTLGRRRLLKLYESRESGGVYANRFPLLDNGRRGTYHELSCDKADAGCRIMREDSMAVVTDVLNACIYPIDAPLGYTDRVRTSMQRSRIRYDGITLFPEAMNNDIRKKAAYDERFQFVYIPKSNVYRYFDNLEINDQSNMVYFNAYGYDWFNLNADEIKCVGRYEITIKLPPVPRNGVYELRYSVLAQPSRGIAQIYFGTDPDKLAVAGIPIDLMMEVTDPRTGWEADSDDDDYNAEVDKRMRNNGFMKGAKSVCLLGNVNQTARDDTRQSRRIIVRQYMSAAETYYLRVKSVLDSDRKEFYLDYLEYCAKEVYDNPETSEDIW